MSMETKSPEMVNALDDLSLNIYGRSRSLAKAGNSCVSCGKDASEFRDELSRREYGISGLCQKCQDMVFGA